MSTGKRLTTATSFLLASILVYDLTITHQLPQLLSAIAAVVLLIMSLLLLKQLITTHSWKIIKIAITTIVLATLVYLLPRIGMPPEYSYIAIGVSMIYIVALVRIELD